MALSNLLAQRLRNQHLAYPTFQRPQEVVAGLLALQAQEYASAKWAIGLRARGLTDATVEAAFNAGEILRTHILRPTWHFVAPGDLRWLLHLTGPRVHAANASMYRKLELDAPFLNRCLDVLSRALEGGRFLTRTELQTALERAGIIVGNFTANRFATSGQRLAYVVMHAELEGLLCSGPRQGGPRQGKQFTYALLDERVPATPPRSREEALAELTRRYVASRGPATVADLVWWSGLTVKEARAGIATLPAEFVRETWDGQEYWFVPPEAPLGTDAQTTFLLPDYDEYGISYRDRRALFAEEVPAPTKRGEEGAYYHQIVVDGYIASTWQRTTKSLTIQPFAPLTEAQHRALDAATQRYQAFVNGEN